jgi:hypothetical protein
MAEPWLDRDFTHNVRDILQRADQYHDRYYAVETFGGPSLHFHRRALGLGGAVSDAERIELIYAVLTSWGMHRMGDNGSKMQPFEEFSSSVAGIAGVSKELTELLPSQLDEGRWSALERVFKGVSVMASGTTIVGNSKVMSHLFPNLVPPIDREYTLSFLFSSKMFQNRLDWEWRLMRKILAEFFYPVAADPNFQQKAVGWISSSQRYPWDTSALKVVDNLVIGAMKARG